MEIKIQSLTEFSCSGVYCVINRSKRRVYVGFGVNMLNSLTRLIGDLNTRKSLKEMSLETDELEAFVAEKIETETARELRVRMGHWVEEYKKLGYSLYRSYVGMKYKVKTVLDVQGRVIVMLTRPGCPPIVVGVFRQPINAKQFVDLNYRDKEVLAPIYAKNEDTRNFLLSRQ